MKKSIRIRTPDDIIPVVKEWENERQENFLVVTLNGKHDVIKVHHVSKGLVNETVAHPRECFYPAIKDNAVAVCFVHNHPSGDVRPSEEDKGVTDRLVLASVILGFNVLDHIIISKNGWFSFKEEGLINSSPTKEEVSFYVNSLKNN